MKKLTLIFLVLSSLPGFSQIKPQLYRDVDRVIEQLEGKKFTIDESKHTYITYSNVRMEQWTMANLMGYAFDIDESGIKGKVSYQFDPIDIVSVTIKSNFDGKLGFYVITFKKKSHYTKKVIDESEKVYKTKVFEIPFIGSQSDFEKVKSNLMNLKALREKSETENRK